MKEKREEEENPLVEEAREQEHKGIEEDIQKLGEQKWYLKSKIIYVLCFITRQSVICMYSVCVKNDRRCKTIVFNDCDDYDGVMVFEVLTALCVGSSYCCGSLSCIYSEVCEISCSCIGYSYIIIICIIIYNNTLEKGMQYGVN